MPTKTEMLKNMLVEYWDYFELDWNPTNSIPEPPNLPKYELYARDYISLAETELGRTDKGSHINCISHLKRAMDCQLDAFFHSFGLTNIFHKRNLKFEKKLEFLEAAGIYSSRTLSRLNTIRNRIEHRYEVPKIEDLEVYFDLVVAFVSLLESTVLLLSPMNITYAIIVPDDKPIYEHIDDTGETFPVNWFSIGYDSRVPNIKARWHTPNEPKGFIVTTIVTTDDIYEFAYFFRVLVLLLRRDAFASDKYLLSQLF